MTNRTIRLSAAQEAAAAGRLAAVLVGRALVADEQGLTRSGDTFATLAYLWAKWAAAEGRTALQHRTTIETVCMYCGAFVGTKDGYGMTGTSHGVCSSCADATEDEQMARYRARTGRA